MISERFLFDIKYFWKEFYVESNVFRFIYCGNFGSYINWIRSYSFVKVFVSFYFCFVYDLIFV